MFRNRAGRAGAPLCGLRRRGLHAVTLVMLAAAAAGCTTSGQPGGIFASARGSTIAFESIDGPPPAVFRKLVTRLGEEAEARRVAVVSREGAASYRVRGYLSAQVERGKTSIAWVLDIYDADKRRALRIAGEEPAGRAGRDAWSAADDQVLRQIARNGMDRIATFLNSPDQPPAVAPPPEPGIAVAAAQGHSAPAAAGSFRTAEARQTP